MAQVLDQAFLDEEDVLWRIALMENVSVGIVDNSHHRGASRSASSADES